ncbi:MAG: Asp-tRNA(Asn)/Glu-tRNA(Gln) amidotransferase subunit GatB [Methanothrix sp.]|nr:MAG: Asp-tRNA(Asn)/Glu-tRNA(Gln) amidotransferase subunit GatB [Methanothrix sp.]
MKFETVIGLEVHLQLKTETKAFCGCRNHFGQAPNTQVCPVCLGFPGSLPVLNEKAFFYAIKVALALGCKIQDLIKFDRKNYYYPDLPKNYQISQYDMPLSYDGHIDIDLDGKTKRIGITRAHMEEDAGKLVHPEGADHSLVDYNRGGTPLLEIVSEPDLSTPEEAYLYLTKLKSILSYLKVSDCDMEKGSLRCDANISIRPVGETKLGTKVEVKNMNSFKGVKQALEHEEKRQAEAMEDKVKIVQETRLWDPNKCITISMRSKEEAQDYRYFPEPDLVPFVADKKIIEEIRATLPELPEARCGRFMKEFELSLYDASVLTSDIDLAEYFENAAKASGRAKIAANWIMGDIMALMNEKNITILKLGLPFESLADIIKMIDAGSISGKIAKEVLKDAIETGKAPKDIVESKGMTQISDTGFIEEAVKAAIAKNEKSVADYKSGKKNALGFLVGQIMKETKGKANPALVNEILKKNLGE